MEFTVFEKQNRYALFCEIPCYREYVLVVSAFLNVLAVKELIEWLGQRKDVNVTIVIQTVGNIIKQLCAEHEYNTSQ